MMKTATPTPLTTASMTTKQPLLVPAWAQEADGHDAWHTRRKASRSRRQRNKGGESGLIQMLRAVAVEFLAQDASPAKQGDPLDFTLLARETACRFEDDQGSARHPIQFEGMGECWVQGDQEHLRVMALCLLLNASGHSSPDRAISVAVWCHGEHAHLSVLDRGAGPLPIEKESLFQPFRRLEARPEALPYTGEESAWWLSLAAHIAYAHGGDILVAGTPGLGSEVDVRLSLCRPAGS